MKSVIVGTAGHIDHGKTALVKALTGIDADRLEEEKRRGITIDLGFAHLELSSKSGERLRFGFVDVPGHERFVRNMLAGVGGMDLVLLVIAADEGIKPQTREHFDICRLLSIPRGITVLTKSDLVDSETLDVVRLELQEFLRGSFLEGCPVVAVSSLQRTGLDELKRQLIEAAETMAARDPSAITRLPIDRVFTMRGFGTVVTGTLVAGAIRREDELELFPSKRAGTPGTASGPRPTAGGCRGVGWAGRRAAESPAGPPDRAQHPAALAARAAPTDIGGADGLGSRRSRAAPRARVRHDPSRIAARQRAVANAAGIRERDHVIPRRWWGRRSVVVCRRSTCGEVSGRRFVDHARTEHRSRVSACWARGCI